MYFDIFEWVVLGGVLWALSVMFVLILMRMSGDQDRDARRAQQQLIPYSDETITSISW